MICPRCGNYHEGEPAFCPSCGAPNPRNPQPGGPGYGAPGGFRAPIRYRNIVVCILLSIVTCGIYGLYWLACMADDLNTACGVPQDTSGGMVVLLSIVTCGIYELFWLYRAGEKVSYIKARNTGYPDNSAAVLYLVLGILSVGIVSLCLIQNELNQVASV